MERLVAEAAPAEDSIEDLVLVQRLAAQLDVPLLAEGRFKLPEEVKQALALGATAVVVGGAITRPQQITQWFVDTLLGKTV